MLESRLHVISLGLACPGFDRSSLCVKRFSDLHDRLPDLFRDALLSTQGIRLYGGFARFWGYIIESRD